MSRLFLTIYNMIFMRAALNIFHFITSKRTSHHLSLDSFLPPGSVNFSGTTWNSSKPETFTDLPLVATLKTILIWILKFFDPKTILWPCKALNNVPFTYICFINKFLREVYVVWEHCNFSYSTHKGIDRVILTAYKIWCFLNPIGIQSCTILNVFMATIKKWERKKKLHQKS